MRTLPKPFFEISSVKFDVKSITMKEEGDTGEINLLTCTKKLLIRQLHSSNTYYQMVYISKFWCSYNLQEKQNKTRKKRRCAAVRHLT